MKLLIAVPTFENIDPEVFKAIYELDTSPFDTVYFDFVRGYDCARARNLIVEKAIDKVDYILMVDSDVVIPSDTLVKFMSGDSIIDIELGVYPRKNMRQKAELFSLSGDGFTPSAQLGFSEIRQLKKFHGATRFQVSGGGLGCALIKTDIFKHLDTPYFMYVNYPNGEVLSEDLYFCSNARKHGFDIWASTEIFCGHIKKQINYE